MRKIYFFSYFIVFLSLFAVSCSQDETEIVLDTDTEALVEPDFFENDGSAGLDGEERPEEEAPGLLSDAASKSYYYDYTLLKPSGLKQTDVDEIKCGDTKEMPLLVGSRKKKVGVVKVSNDDENLYLTVKANDQKYLKKVYFYIGEKESIPFYSNGYPKLYKFDYKAFPYYYGGQKKATYIIPLSSIDTECFEIVAYAKVFDRNSWCYYSAFAYDASRTQEYTYSYYTGCYYFKEWVRSFEYCTKPCTNEIIAHGFKKKNPEHSYCFTTDGFSDWGWTNNLGTFELRFELNRFRVPLFIDGATCDESDAKEIGYARVEVYSEMVNGVEELLVDIKYVMSDAHYVFDEVNLYIGTDKYPKDANGDDTIDPAYYDYHQDLEGVTDYIFTGLPWEGVLGQDVFMISQAKVSPVAE